VKAKFQIEQENTLLELSALKSQVDNIKHELANARKENNGANETVAVLQKENESIQQELDSINHLTETQIGDLPALGEQRTNLLRFTRRQDLALE
jgi:predicted nuclease with TOPRIM domain